MSTKESKDPMGRIKKAILDGYNILIKREVKDGMVYAKMVFYKYDSNESVPIGREEELGKLKH